MAHIASGKGPYNPRMTPRAAAVVLLLAAAVAQAGALDATLPPGVPDARSLGWELVSGDVAKATDAARYEFYVNPRREAIYELVRYRFTRNGREESEKVVWNRPEIGQRPECYSREAGGRWRALTQGSVEYRDEMITLMRVYGLHREARLGIDTFDAR